MIIGYFAVKAFKYPRLKNSASKFALFGTKFPDQKRFWANGAPFGLHFHPLNQRVEP